METKKKVRKGASLHPRNEACAVMGMVALMRRAHGLTTQQQIERARRTSKNHGNVASNDRAYE